MYEVCCGCVLREEVRPSFYSRGGGVDMQISPPNRPQLGLGGRILTNTHRNRLEENQSRDLGEDWARAAFPLARARP